MGYLDNSDPWDMQDVHLSGINNILFCNRNNEKGHYISKRTQKKHNAFFENDFL